MNHPLSRIGSENAEMRGEITGALKEVFGELRRGEIDIKLAFELNNTAGKIFKSHTLDLAEAHFLNERSPGAVPQLPNSDG